MKKIDPRMHSAEHILNGTMVKLFGCGRSVSAHVEKKKSKCDYYLHRRISKTDIDIIENQVNEVILNNLEVTCEYIHKEEAEKKYDMRKVPEAVTGKIRIVNIGDYDACPCSGEHVGNTSEIGKFKIISFDQDNEILRLRFKLEDR